ncbi:hypothetical protein GCM10007938_16720 [Vibrio zhanjiangensis]|uniref:Pilus assembly protein PilP n=1 Tax=Vibrio zhanjiangensis TaxID=1046128 RepID=A0ABQ6EY32_9VIBR|nr:pilus assembly protein PilP [Vibrio zhanjiangensis]GLT17894.1 hypothetical protein GCM10007938_16720 [Vibrio zhanjiangensis]
MQVKVMALICGFLFGCRANQGPLPIENNRGSRPHIEIEADTVDLTYRYSPSVFESKLDLKRDPFSFPALFSQMRSPETPCDSLSNPSRVSTINFPIESLRLAGVIHRQTDYVALIELPDGRVNKGLVGQEIGLEKGRITNITPEELSIGFWIADEQECRLVKNTILAISQ